MKTVLVAFCLLANSIAFVMSAEPAPGNPFLDPPPVLAGKEARHEVIRGIVKERKEKKLTLTDLLDETEESRFILTADTKYLKDGKEAEADDVTEGALVSVKATKLSEGKYEAAEVNVISNRPLK